MPTMRSPNEDTIKVVPDHAAERLAQDGWEDLYGDPVEVPNVSDLKETWVEYAVTQGYDPDEGLTKQELIDTYNEE